MDGSVNYHNMVCYEEYQHGDTLVSTFNCLPKIVELEWKVDEILTVCTWALLGTCSTLNQ